MTGSFINEKQVPLADYQNALHDYIANCTVGAGPKHGLLAHPLSKRCAFRNTKTPNRLPVTF